MYRKCLAFLLVVGLTLVGCARAESQTGDHNEDPYPVPQATTPSGPDDPANQPPYPEPGGDYDGPLLPQAGDDDLERGEVFIDTYTLLTMESYPPQFALVIRGSLPTPCHELRAVVEQPDDQNRIMIETYSVFDPEEACILVLQPFEVSIALGSFPVGEYSVYVDGKQVAEFTSP